MKVKDQKWVKLSYGSFIFYSSLGLELGVAEHSLMKIIAEATGRTLAQIKTDVANSGDMGIVAQQSKRNQAMLCVPASLMVTDVFEKLREIAKMTGQSVSPF